MILLGDCRATLKTIEANSVQCCVTSPPYYGLRDYGTGYWEGGDPNCDHRKVKDTTRAVATLTLGGGKKTTGHQQEGFGRVCGHCGATRKDDQIGLEEEPWIYVENLVMVFEEVRRILKPDGTLWINLGDSYARNPSKGGSGPGGKNRATYDDAYPMKNTAQRRNNNLPTGLKAKDLIGIPWRVAFALQEAGWWLRADNIWAKPAPMPEPVTDRTTRAHEYVFHLSKSERYYYDAKAIAERAVSDRPSGNGYHREGLISINNPGQEKPWTDLGGTRNARSVWLISSEPYPDAHFAVMPSALAQKCILAGSRIGDTVLDPFMGSGTVAEIAQRLGRKWIGCELNSDYGALIQKRTAQRGLL